MRIAIAGFAREGQSALKYLRRDPAFKKAEVWVLDKNKDIAVPRGIHRQTGLNYLQNLDRFDLIFRTPGLPFRQPELQRARKSGVVISSATKLFLEHCPAQILGITGSKGKSTAATLLYKILKTARRNVFLAGNIGTPALDILPRLKKTSLVVLELSSFQLQDLTQSPRWSVILSTFPEHQDAHGSVREYYLAKSNLCRYQKKTDAVFFLPENPVSRRLAALSPGKKIPVIAKTFRLFSPNELKIKGAHSFLNAAVAATVAVHLHVPVPTIRRAVKNFRGLEHRLELVRTVHIKPRVRQAGLNTVRLGPRLIPHRSAKLVSFYNDSASTNPQATVAALAAFPDQRRVLITGGKDKNLSYRQLSSALKKFPATVILMGENKHKIARALKNSGADIRLTKNMRQAVHAAYKCAASCLLPPAHSVIIFSPAAASFDMFANYAARGREFKRLVRQLPIK